MATQYVPQGGEFRANTYTAGSQYNSSIAIFSDGDFVVTWTSYGEDGSGDGVYGQVYGGDGNPIGSEFRVNTYTTGEQGFQTTTGLADGGFVVTWTSAGQDGPGSGVYGQLYGGDGTRVGGEFRVNTYTPSIQSNGSITSLADGGFVVTWTSYGQDGSSGGVYGQVYGADGTRVGSEFRVNTYTAESQYGPSIDTLADGGFVVTWDSEGQDGSSGGVYGQIYGGDGSRVGSEFRVNTYTESWQAGQARNAVAILAHGGFVVTWRSFDQDGSHWGVYGQVYGGDGTRVGSEFRVNSYATDYQTGASIDSLADGGFVVTWTSAGQDGSDSGIYGQLYSGDGTAVGGEFRVNTYTTGIQSGPSATSLPDGGFVVTWRSDGQDGSGDGVYGQVYGRDGIRVGGEFRANTYTTGDQGGKYVFSPSATSLPDGRFVVTWDSEGQDGSGYGVYGQIMSYDNSAPSGTATISGTVRQGQTLTANISDIADEDGIYTATISYQWLRDGIAITGAAESSYTLTQADVGRNVSLRYSYTDNHGTAESVTSAAKVDVQNVNDVATGLPSLSGTARQGQTLTADISGVTDADGINGSTVAYQWLRNGSAITGATGSSCILTQADVGRSISIRYSYTDNYGTSESLVSSATSAVQNVNDLPSGNVPITGTARQGQMLSTNVGGISDAEGINTATIAYQWLRDGSAISDANGSSYILNQADVDRTISVNYSYIDNYGTAESVTSAATVAVQNLNDFPRGQLLITVITEPNNGSSSSETGSGSGSLSYSPKIGQ